MADSILYRVQDSLCKSACVFYFRNLIERIGNYIFFVAVVIVVLFMFFGPGALY